MVDFTKDEDDDLDGIHPRGSVVGELPGGPLFSASMVCNDEGGAYASEGSAQPTYASEPGGAPSVRKIKRSPSNISFSSNIEVREVKTVETNNARRSIRRSMTAPIASATDLSGSASTAEASDSGRRNLNRARTSRMALNHSSANAVRQSLIAGHKRCSLSHEDQEHEAMGIRHADAPKADPETTDAKGPAAWAAVASAPARDPETTDAKGPAAWAAVASAPARSSVDSNGVQKKKPDFSSKGNAIAEAADENSAGKDPPKDIGAAPTPDKEAVIKPEPAKTTPKEPEPAKANGAAPSPKKDETAKHKESTKDNASAQRLEEGKTEPPEAKQPAEAEGGGKAGRKRAPLCGCLRFLNTKDAPISPE